MAAVVQITRGELGGASWELAMRAPSPQLTAYIRELQGYVERADSSVRRREFAGLQIVVILEFEPRLRVYGSGQERTYDVHPGGFVAGLDDRFTLTEHGGLQAGIQLNLHPLGARRVFGVPMHELRGRTISFADLVPQERHLSEELAELSSWDARFDRVERFVRQRLVGAPPPDPAVAWAIERLAAASGRLNLEQLARDLGYSHKHVIARFHDQVGVPPKLWARVLRFERLRRELSSTAPRSIAALAQTCGYYDQAHLARDVRRFTGSTATELLQPQQAFVAASG